MRAISIEKVTPGMQVGRTIYGANGEVLLAAGVKLTPNFINRLCEIGIVALYIHDEKLGNIEIEDVVSDQTRIEALKVTKEVMTNIKINPKFDVNKVNNVVNNIIDDLLSNKNMVVNLMDIRALNDYTFGHSVNVAILSIIVGIALEFDQKKLKILAAGALFHDIGKTLLPQDILHKGSLSKKEKEVMEQHASFGFDILRRIENFNLVAAHVALQHHERYDGTGFPRMLVGEDINEYARIVSVCDVYDRMTTEAVGQSRVMPFQAIEIIVSNSGKFFDPIVVEKFIYTVAIFPVGTEILLNTGEKGVIVKAFKEFPTRPKVKVLINQDSKQIDPPYEIDLRNSKTYCIIRVLEEE